MTPEQIAAVIARLRQRGSHQIDLHSPGSGHEAEFSPDPLCAEAAAMLTALLTERGALLRVAEAARKALAAKAAVNDARERGLGSPEHWSAAIERQNAENELADTLAAVGSNADAR